MPAGTPTTTPASTTTTPDVTTTPDGGATVTVPDVTTTTTTTPDVTTPDVTTPAVTTPDVVSTPDGGATVTVPDTTAGGTSDVIDTFDPDTGTYVEVGGGGGGGDFGDDGLDFRGGSSGGGSGKPSDLDELSLGDMLYANGGMLNYATGGISDLGGYSDGGRLLKGPGDGVSDSIPAMIGRKQPARLADGEFVIPARIVSELGNGSTDAGARKLYQMMDRIQAARKRTTGKNRVAVNSRADKMMPV